MNELPETIYSIIEQGQVQYEQFGYRDLREEALKLIPVLQLQFAAVGALRKHQKALGDGPMATGDGWQIPHCESDVYESAFLAELAKWFKRNFFKWVDSPDCERCGGKSQFKRRSRVRWSVPRKPWTGIRPLEKPYIIDVEDHECTSCHHITTFPRHTDCAILLETRRGRCAEWSYVFALMCKALDYEIRIIYDITDHLWTEIYSQSRRRWVMVDPSEAAVDLPLLYEKGWGKKLSYIIATGTYGPQDVSWRYSANHSALKQRRDPAADKLLIDEIVSRRNQLLEGKPHRYKLSVMKKVISELAELMLEPIDRSDDYSGRTSGDAEWIRSRAEDGLSSHSVRTEAKILIAREKPTGTIKLSYSAAADMYCMEEAKYTTYESWMSLVFKADNIIRKEEEDWQMAYLARKDALQPGVIEWRFEAPTTSTIQKVEVNPGSMIKDDGCITWELESEDDAVMGKMTNVDAFSLKLLIPCRSLTIRATLSSPDNSPKIAWQHAQLFRESTKSTGKWRDFGFTFTVSK